MISILQKVVVCGLLFVLGLHGQGVQCTLTGEPTQAVSATTCFDAAAWDGKTVALPQNMTNFAKDGLVFCPMNLEFSGADPVVLFIVDQSNSMDPNCSDCYPENGWLPGDPYEMRAGLVKDAIQYLHNSGTSYAGYIEFALDLLDTAVAITLLNAPVVQQLTGAQSPVQIKYETGTHYEMALGQAAQFITDFRNQDPPTNNIHIVFISDGKPNRGSSNPLALIENIDVPIHGVFLGREGNEGQLLETISLDSEGSYHLVNPNDSSGLKLVMDGIMEKITSNRQAATLSLQVNDKTIPTAIQSLPNGYSQMKSDKMIPLAEGENTFALELRYSDENGDAVRLVQSTFTLALTQEAVVDSFWQGPEFFTASCQPQNSIRVGAFLNPTLPSHSGGALGLQNTPHVSGEELTHLDIQVQTAWYKGDSLQLQVTNRWQEQQVLTLQQISTTATGALYQVKAVSLPGQSLDSLTFLWQHPDNPRDTVQAELLVYDIPQVQFTQDTMYVNAIAAVVQDRAVTQSLVPAHVYYEDGQLISPTNLFQTAAGVYAIEGDWSQLLQEQLADQIYIEYKDGVFGIPYRDTVTVLYEVPTLPVVTELWDIDGNGAPDNLRLQFDQMPTEQEFTGALLIWGANGQDSVFLPAQALQASKMVDSLGTGQSWILSIDIETIPTGHTSGFAQRGLGELQLSGIHKERHFAISTEVLDKVAPIVTDFVVHADSDSGYMVRFSEPLKDPANAQWFLHYMAGDEEVLSVDACEYNEGGEWYVCNIITALALPQSGDSVRLQVYARGGVRDSSDNGGHINNPYVIVKGARPPQKNIKMNIRNAIVQYNPVHDDFYGSLGLDGDNNSQRKNGKNGTKGSQLIAAVFDKNGVATEYSTGKVVPVQVVESGLVLQIEAKIPQLYGVGSDGSIREGVYWQNQLVWNTQVKTDIWLFDGMGQFIDKQEQTIELNNPDWIDASGEVAMLLLWPVQPHKGLVSAQGRAIANGPLVVKIKTTLVAKATQSVESYNADGTLSSHSVEQGDVLKKKEEKVVKIGYMRWLTP